MTARPTDEKLDEIRQTAEDEVTGFLSEPDYDAAEAAGRRALYEAGIRKVIEYIDAANAESECACTDCVREDLLGEDR